MKRLRESIQKKVIEPYRKRRKEDRERRSKDYLGVPKYFNNDCEALNDAAVNAARREVTEARRLAACEPIKALKHYEGAMEVMEDSCLHMFHEPLARLAMEMGDVALRIEEYELAVDEFGFARQCLEVLAPFYVISRSTEDAAQGEAYAMYGVIRRGDQVEKDELQFCYYMLCRVVKSIEMRFRREDHPGLCFALRALADVAQMLKRYDNAIALYSRYITICERAKRSPRKEVIANRKKLMESRNKMAADEINFYVRNEQIELLVLEETEVRNFTEREVLQGLVGLLEIFQALVPTTEKDIKAVQEGVKTYEKEQAKKNKLTSPTRKGTEKTPDARALSPKALGLAPSSSEEFRLPAADRAYTAKEAVFYFHGFHKAGKNAIKAAQIPMDGMLEVATDLLEKACNIAQTAGEKMIGLEVHRDAQERLAFGYFKRSEEEVSKERSLAMLKKAIIHYEAEVNLTDAIIGDAAESKVQLTVDEEYFLIKKMMDLAHLAVKLDRLHPALQLLRKVRELRGALGGSVDEVDSEIETLAKRIAKADNEIIENACARASTHSRLGIDDGETISMARAVELLKQGKEESSSNLFPQAEDSLLKCLAIFDLMKQAEDPTLPPDEENLNLINALISAGGLFYSMGLNSGMQTVPFFQYNELALPFYLEALSLQEARHGKDHSECGATVFNLACCFYNLERFEQARTLFKRCREIKLLRGESVSKIDENLDVLEECVSDCLCPSDDTEKVSSLVHRVLTPPRRTHRRIIKKNRSPTESPAPPLLVGEALPSPDYGESSEGKKKGGESSPSSPNRMEALQKSTDDLRRIASLGMSPLDLIASRGGAQQHTQRFPGTKKYVQNIREQHDFPRSPSGRSECSSPSFSLSSLSGTFTAEMECSMLTRPVFQLDSAHCSASDFPQEEYLANKLQDSLDMFQSPISRSTLAFDFVGMEQGFFTACRKKLLLAEGIFRSQWTENEARKREALGEPPLRRKSSSSAVKRPQDAPQHKKPAVPVTSASRGPVKPREDPAKKMPPKK